jgi:hypothetical protein
LTVDRQYVDARRALEHASLVDLAQETLVKVARERESLDAVEANLQKVLRTATDIDRRRVQVEHEKKLAQERKREEQELRGRLSDGRSSISELHVSDSEADRSAGVAVEAEIISQLLVESDRMLREFD